jgi:NFU1 iron-sulfur cluster scaffold homolog, mitochondrial
MSFRVQEIQPTPNPNAAKFVLDRPIVQQPTSFFNAAAAKGNAVAEQLFAIPGVSSLLLLGDFITVNKTPESRWDQITPRVKTVLGQQV